MTPRTVRPRRAGERRPGGRRRSGAQPQRGRPTLTSMSTSRDAGGRGGVDGRLAVDGDGHADAAACSGGHGAQAVGVERLVGEEQVVAEAGRGHADHLPRRGAGEAWCGRGGPGARGERRALVGLDVRAQRGPGRAAAIVARLCSKASASRTSAGVGRSCDVHASWLRRRVRAFAVVAARRRGSRGTASVEPR